MIIWHAREMQKNPIFLDQCPFCGQQAFAQLLFFQKVFARSCTILKNPCFSNKSWFSKTGQNSEAFYFATHLKEKTFMRN